MKRPKLPKGYEWAKVGDTLTVDHIAVYANGCTNIPSSTVRAIGKVCVKYTVAKPCILSPLQREFDRTTIVSRMLRACAVRTVTSKNADKTKLIAFNFGMVDTAIKLAITELEKRRE